MDKTQILVAATALAVLVVGIILFSGGGIRQPGGGGAEDAPLVNSYWALVAVDGDAFVMPEGMAREPHFVLHMDDNRVAGYSGCNNIAGTYTVDGDALSFGEGVAMTRMACVVGMDTEALFTDILKRTVGWRIAGESLTLTDTDGADIAAFERRLMK